MTALLCLADALLVLFIPDWLADMSNKHPKLSKAKARSLGLVGQSIYTSGKLQKGWGSASAVVLTAKGSGCFTPGSQTETPRTRSRAFLFSVATSKGAVFLKDVQGV